MIFDKIFYFNVIYLIIIKTVALCIEKRPWKVSSVVFHCYFWFWNQRDVVSAWIVWLAVKMFVWFLAIFDCRNYLGRINASAFSKTIGWNTYLRQLGLFDIHSTIFILRRSLVFQRAIKLKYFFMILEICVDLIFWCFVDFWEAFWIIIDHCLVQINFENRVFRHSISHT